MGRKNKNKKPKWTQKPGKLGNYRVYLRSLLQFARIINVSVHIKKKKDTSNEFSMARRAIYVDGTMSQAYIISTIAHELGHFMDYQKNPTRFDLRQHWDGRNRFEEGKSLTPAQKDCLFQNELRAWRHGDSILKMLKIPKGKWYYKDRQSSLNHYRSAKVERE